MRIAITGASGLLGRALLRQASVCGHTPIAGIHLSPLPLHIEQYELDVTAPASIASFLESSQPDWVIHTAAMTDVDRCEREPELARRINADATQTLVEIAAGLSVKVLYVSTDYVFDGLAGPYKEDDPTNAINYYGATKLAGEHAVRSGKTHHLIVRSSSFLGWGSADRLTFAQLMLAAMRNDPPFLAASDQRSNVTPIDDLALGILLLIEQNLEGTWHVAHPTILARFELAVMLAEAAGLSPTIVRPVLYASLDRPAQRPLMGGLVVRKFTEESNFHFQPIADSITKFISDADRVERVE